MAGLQAPLKTGLGPPVASSSVKGKARQTDDDDTDMAAPAWKGKGITEPIKEVEVSLSLPLGRFEAPCWRWLSTCCCPLDGAADVPFLLPVGQMAAPAGVSTYQRSCQATYRLFQSSGRCRAQADRTLRVVIKRRAMLIIAARSMPMPSSLRTLTPSSTCDTRMFLWV
jgi:hypothetical protein